MKPLPPTFALNCPNDCWLVVAPHNDRPGGRTFERQHLHPAADSGRAHHPRRRRPDRAAAPARAALYPATVRQIVTADIRIIKHELLRSKCGSFEVQFSDDRPPDISIGTTSRAAGCGRTCSPASTLEQAKAFARAERDKSISKASILLAGPIAGSR
jgi:hypothetical protein